MPDESIEVKPCYRGDRRRDLRVLILGRPLGNQQFQEVHDALMAHQVES